MKIETGLPIPEPLRKSGREGTGMKATFNQMNVGDSLVWPKTHAQTAGAIYGIARLARVRVSIRKQLDGSIRVWRVG